MTSCLPKSKHVKLTQACYPKGKAANAKPNSSELQYLAYYTSSRPKKLIKVGGYIRQKIVKDVYWNRQPDVIVSLAVCATLIEKCHANLNLFAEDTVAIIQTATTCDDLIIIQQCKTTFEAFCKYYDGSALGIDTSFTTSYLNLLRTFTEFAISSRKSDVHAFRFAGVEAIASACSSAAIQASNHESQVITVMPKILENLTPLKADQLYSVKQQVDKQGARSTMKRRLSAITEAAPSAQIAQPYEASTQEQIQMCSLATLKTLYESNDAIHIRDNTRIMLDYLEGNRIDAAWSSNILQIVAEWAPINLRFHILGSCLQQLELSDSPSGPSGRHSDILRIIHGLLTSKVNLIGLSTTDVLDNLLNIASKVLQSSGAQGREHLLRHFDSEIHSNTVNSSEVAFLDGVTQAVVAITAHSYYKTQIPDMFAAVLSRVSLVAPEDDVRSPVLNLFYMDVAIQLIKQSDIRKGTSEARALIPISTFDMDFNLLHSKDMKIRRKFAALFTTYLTVECTRSDRSDSILRPNSPTLQHLTAALYRHLRDRLSSDGDFSMLSDICHTLCTTIPKPEAMGLLPLLKRTQSEQASNTNIASVGHGQVGRLIEDTLANILLSCGEATAAEGIRRNVGTGKSTPRSSSEVLDYLLGIFQNDFTAEERAALETPWSPEVVPLQVNQSMSLRQSHRSRMVSSAAASREQFEVATSPVTARTTASGRIGELKMSLSHPRKGLDLATLTKASQTNLDDLFDGIEMQPISMGNGKNPPEKTNGDVSPVNERPRPAISSILGQEGLNEESTSHRDPVDSSPTNNSPRPASLPAQPGFLHEANLNLGKVVA